MSFWSGFAGSVAEGINTREAESRKRIDAANERNGKIALHLLESPDADVQMAGLSMLQAASAPAKRKKGLSGFLGNFEEPDDALRPFLDLANAHARPGQLQAPPAEGGSIDEAPAQGAAALPPKSPVEPGSAPLTRPEPPQQPIGSPMALARGEVAPAFGEQNTSAGAQGGFPSPMQAAMQGGQGAQPAAAPPQINVAQTAQRLSQDRGQLAPGQAAALFWPTAATLSANKITSDLGAQAAFLQKLGASPEDVRETMMARMGHPVAAMSATRAGTVKLPSGEIVETYIQRDPASNTVGRMYWNGTAMAPLPAGTIEQKLGGSSGPAITTHMTGAEAEARGYAEPGEFKPGDYVKVTQKGDQVIAEIDTRPVSPFGIQASPTTPYVQGRGGAPEANPNYIAPHPQVTAAKALDAALKADVQVKAGVPAQNVFARYAAGYPALKGLTLAQVMQLAQLPDNALDADVQRILGPVAIAPPPGPAGARGKGAGAAPSDPNQLPADWADKLATELMKGKRPN